MMKESSFIGLTLYNTPLTPLNIQRKREREMTHEETHLSL